MRSPISLSVIGSSPFQAVAQLEDLGGPLVDFIQQLRQLPQLIVAADLFVGAGVVRVHQVVDGQLAVVAAGLRGGVIRLDGLADDLQLLGRSSSCEPTALRSSAAGEAGLPARAWRS
jgi:hypothetical protein